MKKLSILLAIALAAGCASSSDLKRVQDQVSELQNELANLKQTSAAKQDVVSVNEKIAQQTEQLLRSNATLVAKVEQMDERIQNAQGTGEQTNYRIDRLAQQMTQAQRDIEDFKSRGAAPLSGAPAPSPATSGTEVTVPAPTTSSVSPMELYQAAYRDYQRGNFDLAIAGFNDFIRQNAKSDLADNAAYWIGESLFSQKKYQDAIAQFDSVVTKYPQSDKVPGALLKKGYAYIALGEKSQGIVQLQYVVHEHPGSQEASLARQKLKQLGIETR